jgi:hypothetical protein
MYRTRNALVVALCAATLVAGCQSSGASASLAAQATPSHQTGPSLPSGTAAAETVAPQTPAEPSPSPEATASPSPLPSPGRTYVPAPQPSLALGAAGAPADLTSVRLEYLQDRCDSVNPNEGCAWLRVVWQEASPIDVTIRVYAVTSCLHMPTTSGPSAQCVVDGDSIPRASLLLLGTAPASDLSFSFVLAQGETAALGWLPGGGPDVDAVVLQAVNAHGGSQFAIAGSSGSCYGSCTL